MAPAHQTACVCGDDILRGVSDPWTCPQDSAAVRMVALGARVRRCLVHNRPFGCPQNGLHEIEDVLRRSAGTS